MIVEPARRFALFEKRLIVFEPDGSIVGADVVTDGGRTYFELLRGDDRLAVIGGTSEQVRVGDRGGGRRLSYAYRVYFVAEDGRLMSRPLALSERLERLEAARLVDGWLLMSFRDETVAFALPADAPNPP